MPWRKDKPLCNTSAVCEKHSAEHFVVRRYKSTNSLRKACSWCKWCHRFYQTCLHTFQRVWENPDPRKSSSLYLCLDRRRQFGCFLTMSTRRALSQTFEQNVSPVSNHQANPLTPGDLQVIADYVSALKLWEKLTTPDLDVLVYNTTCTRNEPFTVCHDKVIQFTSDNHKDVTAR